jgi:hypothetical protein
VKTGNFTICTHHGVSELCSTVGYVHGWMIQDFTNGLYGWETNIPFCVIGFLVDVTESPPNSACEFKLNVFYELKTQ